MPQEARIQCPRCHGQLEWSPDQDGALDCQCMQCGWSEHVPSSGEISAALISHKENQLGSKPSVEPQLLTERETDLKLLERQAGIPGKAADKASLTDDERSYLEGL